MGEIIGGVFFMAVFIGFIVWRYKNKPSGRSQEQKINEELFWAQREAEAPVIVSSDTLDDD